jgi:hypothetical protein
VGTKWAEAQGKALVLHSEVTAVFAGRSLQVIEPLLIGALTGVLAQSIGTDLAIGDAFREVTLADIRASVTDAVVQQRQNTGIAPDPAGEARLKGVQEEWERVRRRYMPVH